MSTAEQALQTAKHHLATALTHLRNVEVQSIAALNKQRRAEFIETLAVLTEVAPKP